MRYINLLLTYFTKTIVPLLKSSISPHHEMNVSTRDAMLARYMPSSCVSVTLRYCITISAIAEGPRDALVTTNPTTTKHPFENEGLNILHAWLENAYSSPFSG